MLSQGLFRLAWCGAGGPGAVWAVFWYPPKSSRCLGVPEFTELVSGGCEEWVFQFCEGSLPSSFFLKEFVCLFFELELLLDLFYPVPNFAVRRPFVS